MNCSVYQSNLKYDIEHVDEIKDVVWRVTLKDRLGIPRTEKDKKDLDEHLKNLKSAKEILLSYDIDKIRCSEIDYDLDKKFMDKVRSGRTYRIGSIK